MTSYTEEEKRKAVEMVEECVGSVMHATSKSGYPSRLTLYQWLDEWAAYFATVFRLTWSTLAISDLERPAASIDRISFTVSRGTVISSILPGRARQSNRPGKPYGEGRAPGPRGSALLLKLLNFSCSRCSFSSEHPDHFLVNIYSASVPRQRRHRAGARRPLVEQQGSSERVIMHPGFSPTHETAAPRLVWIC